MEPFKHITPESKFKGRVFDYHEDDFCQIELLPRENMTERGKNIFAGLGAKIRTFLLIGSIKSISGISQNHLSPGGFTKTHLFKNKKVRTVNRSITLTEIDAILKDSLLAKFDTVTTGSGPHYCEYSSAFGQKGCAIIYERVRSQVSHIWLDYLPAWADDNMRSEMSKCLTEICSNWDLILVDWRHDIVVDPANDLSLSSYLIGQSDE